jgi:hypothetical protein
VTSKTVAIAALARTAARAASLRVTIISVSVWMDGLDQHVLYRVPQTAAPSQVNLLNGQDTFVDSLKGKKCCTYILHDVYIFVHAK